MASRQASDSGELEDALHKNNIEQWIKHGIDLVTLIDRGDVKNIDDVKQYLACSGDPGCMDRANSTGQTPLMIACRNEQVDIVNFLLESGADINLCCNIGNSALHYACQGVKVDFYLRITDPSYPEKKFEKIITIVEFLVYRGAMLQMNDDGLSQACVAALNSYKHVVDFLASSNVFAMPHADKIKAYTFLGISQAVLQKHHAQACESFHIAASLQSQDDSGVSPSLISPDFDAFFVEMMKKGNPNYEERFEIELKAYYVGLQCIPATIRKMYNFNDEMTKIAQEALFDRKSVEEGYKMLVAIIDKEMEEESLLGMVMDVLKITAHGLYRFPTNTLLEFIPKLLDVYAGAFGGCDSYSSSNSEKVSKKIEGVAHLMFSLTYYPTESKYLVLSLPFVGSIVESLKKLHRELYPGTALNLSMLKVFFDRMTDAMWEDKSSWQRKEVQNRFQFAICRLLYYNGFDSNSDDSLLKTLMDAAPHVRDMNFIVSVSRILLRYGSRTDNVMLEDGVDNDPELLELLEPTVPLPLEELASRTILRNQIPYRGRLPDILCEKIEGEQSLPDPTELDYPAESDYSSDFDSSSESYSD